MYGHINKVEAPNCRTWLALDQSLLGILFVAMTEYIEAFHPPFRLSQPRNLNCVEPNDFTMTSQRPETEALVLVSLLNDTVVFICGEEYEVCWPKCSFC